MNRVRAKQSEKYKRRLSSCVPSHAESATCHTASRVPTSIPSRRVRNSSNKGKQTIWRVVSTESEQVLWNQNDSEFGGHEAPMECGTDPCFASTGVFPGGRRSFRPVRFL